MAAITPSAVIPLGPRGACLEILVKFSAVSTGDTWTSGLVGVIDQEAHAVGIQVTQASAGVNVSHSAGVFTFKPGEDAVAVNLIVRKR